MERTVEKLDYDSDGFWKSAISGDKRCCWTFAAIMRQVFEREGRKKAIEDDRLAPELEKNWIVRKVIPATVLIPQG